MDIKKRRLELKISQMELAKKCGVSIQTVWKWENGCSAPRRENLERLRVVLGVKDDLRDGEPCDHPGCLHHVSHPCEGCGRIGGMKNVS